MAARHGEGLAWSSCSVRKYGCIESFDDAVDELRSCVVVDLLGGAVLVEDPVKEVPLLLAAVEHIWLLSFILALHLNSIKDQLPKNLGKNKN